MVQARTLVAAAAVTLAAPVLAIAPASASPPYFETITEPLSNHFVDFCGVEGLTVDPVSYTHLTLPTNREV